MANPSLQIGNSNWAIKEDNLLGYSTAGTKFLPQPITMTRASAGTRVNPSGLIETVELLGSELVTDGDFALTGTQAQNITGTYWTTGTGWSIGSGLASCDGTQTSSSNLTQNINIATVNKLFKIKFSVTNFQGGRLNLYVGGINFFESSANGDFEGYVNVTNASSDTYIYLNANSLFEGSVTNISVKESTKNNLARVDYDGTASSLLVEPQRTNLLPYSEDFTNVSWIKVNSTVTPNSIISPDGTQNADKFIPNNTTASIFIYNQVTFSASAYTLSFFVKYNGIQYFQLLFGSQASSDFSNFDLINHTVTSGNGNIEDYGNDWYKISLTSNISAVSSEVYLWPIDSATSSRASASTGNGTDGVYMWGAQLEEGSYPTSYIPTSGSTVTRVQDQYSKTGISNLINSEEGVLFLEMAALSNDGTYRQILFHDNAYVNRIALRYMPTSNQIDVYLNNGTVQAQFSYNLSNALDFNKIAFKYKQNDFALWVNGVEVGTDTSGVTFSANTLQDIDFDFTNNYFFFGKVKQLQIFKTALTDTELATLTTI